MSVFHFTDKADIALFFRTMEMDIVIFCFDFLFRSPLSVEIESLLFIPC